MIVTTDFALLCYACHDYNKLHIDLDEYGLFGITYMLIMVKIS